MATTWKSSLKDSIYNKTTAPAKKEIRARRKKKRRSWRNEPRKNQTKQAARTWRPGSREPDDLGCASPKLSTQVAQAWVARPGWSRASPFSFSLIWSDLTLSLSLIWSPSLWSDSLSLCGLIWSSEVRLCLRLSFLKFFWFVNQVLKTRFSSGRHVENDATSDVIRPWKSSLEDSIYRSKSTLLDSSC